MQAHVTQIDRVVSVYVLTPSDGEYLTPARAWALGIRLLEHSVNAEELGAQLRSASLEHGANQGSPVTT